ncbi:MAG: hypothetical protein COU32_02805 [Candidatus Magasanikbacteria bacterium CG10_big_fil_rev_8_21_14_0_10_42_10]|uniref:DUF3048 domain-containing protein n=2 Tax=Candidatus Magasanikiibacteriota TaxID=1752731 RepID=A0A2H0TVW5_9BACT|nr:MAG: hypothetical protein COU32_02805 [Candidatus Magasanikbacteria bacterium CG10_big_fil_rev_8_21_14_0_10_42_10]PIZ92862.1 MAG: hypothetical protein COX82_03885 [Candidatus Magasanikbacteria bacterium CG_4_10_14_0_2_um_filter_41_10]
MKYIITWFQQTKRLDIVAGVCFLLGIGILLSIFFLSPKASSQEAQTVAVDTPALPQDPTPCTYTRTIDGVCVASIAEENPGLIGIMIENHYDARPLSGLVRASVVYEAPVEANFSRFLAIFPEDVDVKKVGPVRSARPYYLDWLSEYPGIMYMHVGGSPEALADIASYGIFDMNEFYHGWYYWRDTARLAPHNAYTSQALWSAALKDYREKHSTETNTPVRSWKFRAWDTCDVQCIHEITTTFAGKTYQATWRYNTSTEQYERFEFGDPVVDPQTHEHITTDTLIVQYVDTTVTDAVGRLAMDTLGKGEAIVFRNGFKVEGQWRKETRKDRTIFYDFDEEGHEIELKPGKIWIVVMNRDDGVSFE